MRFAERFLFQKSNEAELCLGMCKVQTSGSNSHYFIKLLLSPLRIKENKRFPFFKKTFELCLHYNAGTTGISQRQKYVSNFKKISISINASQILAFLIWILNKGLRTGARYSLMHVTTCVSGSSCCILNKAWWPPSPPLISTEELHY